MTITLDIPDDITKRLAIAYNFDFDGLSNYLEEYFVQQIKNKIIYYEGQQAALIAQKQAIQKAQGDLNNAAPTPGDISPNDISIP